MPAVVPEVGLAKLPKQVSVFAPRIALGIPFGRLATVCADVDWHETTIFGLVKRRQALQEEGDYFDGSTTNLWLVRLARDVDGHYHWEDFVPSCKHCKEKMRPVMSREHQPACPVCKARKGKGKCFQFDCPEYSEASVGCGKVEAASRPVYCGSHPYFGGYDATDEYFGNGGPALFQYEESSHEECDNFSMVADQVCDGLQVDIFRGLFSKKSLRVCVDENRQSIISPTEVRKCAGSDPVSSATLVGWSREHVEGNCVHCMYILVQRYGHQSCILRSTEDKPNQWLDWASIEADDECSDFRKQVVVISQGHREPTRVAGLSRDSLWVMDVPYANVTEGHKTASSMASQISWQRVMKFKDVQGLGEDDHEDFNDFPDRLLAAGPRRNQVVIFAADDSCQRFFRPRLLVEIPDSLTDEIKTADLTSIVSVPKQSQDNSEKKLDSGLLPSVVRISGQSGGYLFFDKLGHAYHLRDEAIIFAKEAWAPPDFKPSRTHLAVTFKFKDAGPENDMRMCLTSVLERYEYFQKLLCQWQEGASAEVAVTDANPDTFDHFLTYLHNGTVDEHLELGALARLISLANKYLMQDLVASCLIRILGILQDGKRMQQQETGALAEMLAFSDYASMCCPTLMRKLIDAVLHYRGGAIKDEEFLKKLANSSTKALSFLLAPLTPSDGYCGRFGMRKRRKVVLGLQHSLWHQTLGASESPTWCSHVQSHCSADLQS